MSIIGNPILMSGGGSGVPLLTRAQWDNLTDAQKQAYELVAIQDANSGFYRGELVYGAVYHNLPSGYTRLNYIESTGTQWIDTGITPTILTSADLYNVVPKALSRYGTLLGEGYVTGRIWAIRWANNTSNIQFQLGADTAAIRGPSLSLNTSYDIHVESGKLTVDSVDYTGSAGNMTDPMYPLRFFQNGSGEYGSFQVGESIIYEAGTMIAWFLPALRESDNAPGLYDSQRGAFYTNGGSGQFNYG